MTGMSLIDSYKIEHLQQGKYHRSSERERAGNRHGPMLDIPLICNWLAGCFPNENATGKQTWLQSPS